jgi:hypothetical protein
MTLGEPLRAQKKPPKGGFFCGLRRAMRSITRLGFARRGWFRYYPSRSNAKNNIKNLLFLCIFVLI